MLKKERASWRLIQRAAESGDLELWRGLVRGMVYSPPRAKAACSTIVALECSKDTELHLLLQAMAYAGLVRILRQDRTWDRIWYVPTVLGCSIAGYSRCFAGVLQSQLEPDNTESGY